MFERSVLKSNAKQQLKGKWGLAIGSILVAQLITSMISGSSSFFDSERVTFGLSLINLLLSGVMTFGICRFTLNLAVDKESAKFEDIFSGFRVYLKTLGIFVLMGICIFLGILLLVIPGIIIALMFSQAYYVLCDNSDIGVIDSLKESASLMKGHKWEYVVLQLSFIGWGILACLTLGIGFLWLIPYQQVTMANYYLALKNESN